MLDDEPIMLDAKYQMVIKRWWCGRRGVEDGKFDLSDDSGGLRSAKLPPELHRGVGASWVCLVLGFVIHIFLNSLSKMGVSINS